MVDKKVLYIAIFLIVSLFSKLYGQCDAIDGGILSTDDSTRCIGELTEFTLSGYQGTITWQSSPAGINTWSNITALDTTNHIIVYPIEDTDYRAFFINQVGCDNDSSTVVSIDVLDADYAGATGFSDDPCGLAFNLSAEGVNPGTWSMKTGPGNAYYSPGNTAAFPSVLVDAYGSYVFVFTNASGGCAAVNIKTYEQNTASAQNNIQYCGGFREPFSIEASLSNNEAIGYWTRIGTDYSISNINDTNPIITPDIEGVFSITWTEEYGECTDDTTVTFSTYVQPDASASSFGSVCDSVGTLNASGVLRYTTRYWRRNTGTGLLTFSDSTALSPDVICDNYGEYDIEWIIENNYCVDSDTISATFIEQPVSDAGISPDVCGDTAILNANVSVGSGNWRNYPTQPTAVFNDSFNDSTWVYNNGIYGSYSFIWQETNNICADSDTITFTFFEQPNSNAGLADSSCGVLDTLLAIPSIGTGQWTSLSGAGTASITLPNSPSSAINVSDYGVYTFQWKEVNAICSDSSEVELSFFEQPDANAGLGSDTCGLNSGLSAIPSVSGSAGLWEYYSGPGTSTISSNTDYSTNVEVDLYGNYEFKWTEINALCSDTAIVGLSFVTFPVANAGTDDNACGDNYQLNAEIEVDPGRWSQTGGIGTAEFLQGETDPSTFVQVSDTGIYNLTWRVDNGVCTTDSTISLHFYAQPDADGGLGGDTCGLNFSLNAIPGIVNSTGSWEYLSGPGSANFAANNEASTTVDVTLNGGYQFVWTEINAVCTDTSIVQVSFVTFPIANAGTDDNACGNSFQLNAEASVDPGQWFQSGGMGTAQFPLGNTEPTAIVQVSDTGLYNLTWQVDNGVCTSDSTISLHFYEQPNANAGLGGDTCGLYYSLNAIPGTVGSTGVWEYLSGPGSASFSLNTSASTLVDVSNDGDYQFVWTEINAICSDDAIVSVSFNPKPIANPGLGGDACGNSIQLSAQAIDDYGSWSQISGTGTTIFTPSNRAADAIVEVSDTGIYELLWSVDDGICSADSSITLHFYDQPVVSVMQGFDNCGELADLTAAISVGEGTWSQLSGRGTARFSAPSSTTTNVTVDEFDEYILQWQGENGSCFDEATVTVNFLEIPIANAGINDELCGNVYHLNADENHFDGEWYLFEGPGNVVYTPDSTFPNAKVEVSEPGAYKFVRYEANGICEDTSSVVISFVEMPEVDAGPDQELDNVFETELEAGALINSQSGLWTLLSGTGLIYDNTAPNSSVSDLSLGEAEFVWEVSNDNCSNSDTVKVIVYDIFIPDVITPNNDSDNDYFEIRGIEDLSNVELTVFNRWGIEVYYSSDYQNDWGGTNKSGAELTNDTYFYVINIDNSRIIKGFMVIKR